MKIKLLKDVNSVMGGKKGEVLEYDKDHAFFGILLEVLLENGWAEEYKTLTAVCLECKKEEQIPEDHVTVVHGLNYFCSGECEDIFASKL